MERRHFLHDLAHIAAVPSIFSSLAFNKLDFSPNSLLSNTIEEGKIIVIIRMDGGNDGLNTIIPLDQMSNLAKARPHVILPENKIVSLGSNDLGLHPSLSDFKSFYDEDRFKIIQNVGYPNPDFSHFRSMDIWQSASSSNEYLTSGWMARYIENKHPMYPEEYPSAAYPHPLAVEMGWQSSLLFTGQKSFTSFLARNPTNFQEIINEFDNEYPSDNMGNKLKYLQLIAKQSNIYSKVIKETYEKGNNAVAYGNSNLEKQLEIVSKLIGGGLKSRIYFVEFGGFDTHDTQVDNSDRTKGNHAALLKELNDSVTAFMKNLDAMGRSDDVLTMTFSEFGRTIVSNGSGGTDHGTAAPMFIFGNKVNPEVLGANPLIPANASWQDNLEAEFDFRQVYTSLINQWMGGGGTRAKDVLFKDFEELSIVGDQYIDTDNDGVADMNDSCPNTLEGAIVGLDGCEIFSLPRDNYSIQVLSASCIGSKNGVLKITAADTSYVYKVLVSGVAVALELTSANGHEVQVSDLGVGTYTIDISITEKEGYLQTFEVSVREPAPLQAKANVDYFNKKANLFLEGSELYFVTVNGKELVATENGFEVALKVGNNVIKVSTPLECQGVYEEVVFVSEKVTFYPNPVVNELHIVIPGIDTESLIQVYDTSGNEVINTKNAIFFNRELDLNMGGLHSGIYIVKVNGKTVRETFKIMKQ
jgi:uncharacterized protein (DUF1501 family)